jgi:hypothetical protein
MDFMSIREYIINSLAGFIFAVGCLNGIRVIWFFLERKLSVWLKREEQDKEG